MLTDEQRRLIRTSGIATLHDYRTISPMSGEVFLEGGLLAYYDGRMLLVCGQPLRNQPPSCGEATRAFIRGFVDERCIDSVLYVAPKPLALRDVLGSRFVCEDVCPRVPRSAELFLPVHEDEQQQRVDRVRRRAARRGFEARSRPGGVVDVNHLMITERFFGGIQLSEYLAELVLTLPMTMMSRDVTIIEAWQQGSMRGFVTVHEPFDGVSVAQFIAHDRVTPGACDFLYSQLIDHAHAIGSEFVNVGPSPTAGHYAFKRKWHGVPLVPPYYAVTWRRRARCTRHRTWLLRILGRAR